MQVRPADRAGGLQLTRRAHVRISGRVQGVGFRYAVRRRAQSLRVAGWVRNREDGSVEAVFEGEPDAVESMVEWCRSGGPRGAEVADVDVAWDEPQGPGEFDFSVR